jgi:hypothetical protein
VADGLILNPDLPAEHDPEPPRGFAAGRAPSRAVPTPYRSVPFLLRFHTRKGNALLP